MSGSANQEPPAWHQEPECIVQIWFEDDETGRPARWQLVMVPFIDFATFLEVVDADRLICGSVLHCAWEEGERGVKVIRRRTPIGFRGSTVRRAMLPTWRFVEETE